MRRTAVIVGGLLGVAFMIAVVIYVVTPDSPGSGGPAATVGARAGTLRDTGSETIDRPGTVVSRLKVHGMLTITAPGVVIENCEFVGDGSTPWAIHTDGDGSVTIRDTAIHGDYSDAGISYHNWTAERVTITGMSNDGAKIGDNVTIRDSTINGFAPTSGAHADGLQVVEDVGHVLIENNTIDVGTLPGANSAIFLSPDLGPERTGVGPVVVRGNRLSGGGYTFYDVGGTHGAKLDDVTVTGNTFGRTARYGPVYPEDRQPITQSGNVYVDGSAVTWPS